MAISWTNVNFSILRFCGIHLRAISHQVPKLPVCIVGFKILLLKLLPHVLGANELRCHIAHMASLLFYRKTVAHDEEVRKLYDEMELQIHQEKDRILNEVSDISPGHH